MATNFPTDLVIVVGGGLAGVSACNTVVENGGKTVLIDKSSFCGGNSTKATSGINGAATKTQKAKGIEDSSELFIKDTLKGGAKKTRNRQSALREQWSRRRMANGCFQFGPLAGGALGRTLGTAHTPRR
jgi:succinate dehydrogenase/fumarate reductase flavoprotein subunit